MRILLLSILAVGIIGVMVPSVFGDEEISISTDKMQYGIGDRIKITGEVSDTIKLGMGKLYANVYLYDPDDFQLDYEQVEIRPNGKFGHVITAGERILIDKELSNWLPNSLEKLCGDKCYNYWSNGEYKIKVILHNTSIMNTSTFYYGATLDIKSESTLQESQTIICEEGLVFKDGECLDYCKAGTVYKNGQCIDVNEKIIELEEKIEELEKEKENSEGGGCLIATAAFGSEMAPQVQFLRELRDNTVLQTTSGTTFMTGFNQFYYSFSPYVADYERENPVFKEAVKVTLTPMLTSLTLLNYVEIDTEEEMLGYGIGIILLNIGMYFVLPAAIILQIKRWKSKN